MGRKGERDTKYFLFLEKKKLCKYWSSCAVVGTPGVLLEDVIMLSSSVEFIITFDNIKIQVCIHSWMEGSFVSLVAAFTSIALQ